MSDGAVRYFRGRCFFQSVTFGSLQVVHYEVFVGGMIYSKVLNHTACLGCRAISEQLKTITSAASSTKTALHNVSWVLYLASRQNFIWSQYCNIILIHYVVVYCQSAAFITKQNKTRSGFWYCHLLLAAWSEKTPLLISRSAVCDAAIRHGECKLLPKRQTVIYFSELLYYLCLIKYPDFIMSHLKGSWVLQVCKNLNIILKKNNPTKPTWLPSLLRLPTAYLLSHYKENNWKPEIIYRTVKWWKYLSVVYFLSKQRWHSCYFWNQVKRKKSRAETPMNGKLSISVTIPLHPEQTLRFTKHKWHLF